MEPLTPNHLLTLKSKVILPLPGIFQDADVYSLRRWRRVQYLSNQFWNRWKRDLDSYGRRSKPFTVLERQVQKLILLLAKNEQETGYEIPHRGAVDE